MVDVENIPEREVYERQCYTRARYYLQDNEVCEALETLLIQKDMLPDEIKAAALILSASDDMDEG